MRQFVWVILAIALAAVFAPNAPADIYTLHFSCVDGTPSCITPTNGSFTWDPIAKSFTTIQVIWNGNTFNFTPTAALNGSLPPCYGSDTGAVAVFDLLANCGAADSTPPAPCSAEWVGNTNPATPTFLFQDDNAATCAFTFTLSAASSGGSNLVDGDYSEGSWSVTVVKAPAISKVFSPAEIPLGGGTSLTISIVNPNAATALTGVAFTDTLPAGVTASTASGAGFSTGTCSFPTGGIQINAGSIVVSGLTINAASTCTIQILDLSGVAAGAYTNTTNAVTSNEGGAGNSASAPIVVVAPPSISKAFGGPTVPINQTTSLTFTITNPAANTVSLTGVGFTDTLPSGLAVTSGTSSVCGGTLTLTSPTTIQLAGATVAVAASCQFSVTVTGVAAGVENNTTGSVTSTEGGTGNTASASITVVLPPVISKTFGTVVSIPVSATAVLSFTISNPNATVTLTGVGFTDTLPSGLLVANPNGLTGSCGGGTITATSGTNTIMLAGASLAATSSCTFSVNVKGVREGVQNNLTSQVSSVEGASGNTAAASIVVGDAFQLGYLANLNVADSFVNLTNEGINGGFDPAGDVCANVYVFAADQQLIECCACPLTPNHLKTLSGQSDLINNNLTPAVASAITVGLLVTANPSGGTCNAAKVTASQLTVGLGAYHSNLHALPSGSYGVSETDFSPVSLSASELLKLSGYCGLIQANGSGYGICGSCKQGAAGASRQ